MTTTPSRTGPERDSRVELDARNLRGIAHPVRVRLLAILREEGPATASLLARRLGLNTGATSYHLRQLAAHGFVVEDAGRGTSRERWWQSAHSGTVMDHRALGPDDEGLGWAYLRSVAALYADAMVRAVDEWPSLPQDWRQAATLSDYLLLLTPDELCRLRAEVVAVIQRYRTAEPAAARPEAPAGAVPVTLQLQAFPRPGVLETGADAPSDGHR
jgi:DNA-binding transcriptional ArsR family regulator